jgi:hypothetical protein
MAKTFQKTFFGKSGDSIEQGKIINAYHVSQSVDAFTGAEEYDITISGSLTVQGSGSLYNQISFPGGLTENTASEVYLVLDSGGGVGYKTTLNGAAGSSGTSGINGINGVSGSDGSSGTSGTGGTSGTSGVDGSSGTSGLSAGNGNEGYVKYVVSQSFSTGKNLTGYTLHTDNRAATSSGEVSVASTDPASVTLIKINIGSNSEILNHQLNNGGIIKLRNQGGATSQFDVDSITSGSGVLNVSVTNTIDGVNFADGVATQEFSATSNYYLLNVSRSYNEYILDNQTEVGFKSKIAYATTTELFNVGDSTIIQTYISQSNVNTDFAYISQQGTTSTTVVKNITTTVPQFKTHVTKLSHWGGLLTQNGSILLGGEQVN